MPADNVQLWPPPNREPVTGDVFWIQARTSTGRLMKWKIGVYDDWYRGFLVPGEYSPIPEHNVVHWAGPIKPPAD